MTTSRNIMELRPDKCPITGETEARRVFVYERRPEGEVAFPIKRNDCYYREIWQFWPSGHYVSRHSMEIEHGYSSDYLTNTYGDYEGLHQRFMAIRELPEEMSDNHGRVKAIINVAQSRLNNPGRLAVMDIGSGIGIFPYSIEALGWSCLALDLDPRAVSHLNDQLSIRAICTELTGDRDLGLFDIISFNKVLEHVVDPIGQLRVAGQYLSPSSFVYIEVPDGEMAERHGPIREEFFVEHHHVFSVRSVISLIQGAGLEVVSIERLMEPSTKYTIRAFCTLSAVQGSQEPSGRVSGPSSEADKK